MQENLEGEMKRLKQLLASILFSLVMTTSAFAGQWMQDTTGWWYQNDDGSYPVNCWQWIDGNGDGIAEYYYFNEHGYCLMSTVTPDGNTVNANGAWVIYGRVQTQVVRTEQTDLSAANPYTSPYTGVNVNPVSVSQPVNPPAESKAAETPVTAMVWLSATGQKYHRIPNCGNMNPNKARQVSLEEAVAEGYTACKKCY